MNEWQIEIHIVLSFHLFGLQIYIDGKLPLYDQKLCYLIHLDHCSMVQMGVFLFEMLFVLCW